MKSGHKGWVDGLMIITTFAAAAAADFFYFSFGTTPIGKWTSKFINGFIFNQSSK